MAWLFRHRYEDEVETELTQRDQFNNDDVELAEALVREALQNSLDAGDDKEVKVRFDLLNGVSKETHSFLYGEFKEIEKNLIEGGAEKFNADPAGTSVLVIEDFGTSGLTGEYLSKDKGNFSDFWRRHGKSHKKGNKGGRWGLGKLVYSASSNLRCFFGLTVRSDDGKKLLMGQAVLDGHTIDGQDFAPHGFYAYQKEEKGLQLPYEDEKNLKAFSEMFNLERGSNPGLSVIIPMPKEGISSPSLARTSIINYFYPILTSQLKLDVCGTRINAGTIRTVLNDLGEKDAIPDADILFNFIENTNDFKEEELITAIPGWGDDKAIMADDFDEDDLEKLRNRFADGKILGVRFPMTLRLANDDIVDTYFDAFIIAPEELQSGRDIYVRGGITVPGERKFGERKALGLLRAKDDGISTFLANAENPAHTKWVQSAEKVSRLYKSPSEKIKLVRNALVQLHDIFAQDHDRVDEDALTSFFFAETDPIPKDKKGKKTPPKPDIDKKKKITLLNINNRQGGFTITANIEAPIERFPLNASVQVAYDRLKGSPFKKYNTLDFDFSGDNLTTDSRDANIRSARDNKLMITLDKPGASITAKGFDDNRDLIVRAIAE